MRLIRLMGYSFISPEVVRALARAKRRGVDVRIVLDWKANNGKSNNASIAAMNLLIGAGIPVRTVSVYKILHDKVIVADGRNTQVGSFNFSRLQTVQIRKMCLWSGMIRPQPAAT